MIGVTASGNVSAYQVSSGRVLQASQPYQFTYDFIPPNGPYLVRTTGNGDSVSFTVVDDTEFFMFTQSAGGFGLTVGQNIIHTIPTPLPATLPLFAAGLGIVTFVARRKKTKAVSPT